MSQKIAGHCSGVQRFRVLGSEVLGSKVQRFRGSGFGGSEVLGSEVLGSEVQGSTFRVKDKEGIKDPKSSLKILISPKNCQFGSKFWIRPDEPDVFPINTHPKCSPGTIMQP